MSIKKTALIAIAALFSSAVAQADYTEAGVSVSGSNKALDMVYVKGGKYKRGCSATDNTCEDTEKPAHDVTLSDFYIGKYEVTNAQWKAVTGDNTAADNKPKTGMIWYDVVAFTCKLREKTGKKYRLATDAEFEYAARGGAQSKGYLYSGSNTVNDVAWTSANSGNGIKDVGGKNANELGIYDMSGNAYELTYDSWGLYSSDGAALTNPIDRPDLYSTKVRRGGSYSQPASKSRVSARERRSIKGKDASIGFRLALSVNDSDPAAQVNPCDIHEPLPWAGEIGFRDSRLITAADEVWADDSVGYMLVIKDNGTAAISGPSGSISGEWYTLNSFSLKIVSTGSQKTTTSYPYYMITPNLITLIGDKGIGEGPFGRFMRKKISEVSGAPTAPNITNPTPIEELVGANGNIDMANPLADGRDSRLIEGPDFAWVQDNVALNFGGTHRYRKDFDSESSMRFLVWDNPTGNGSSTLLATGPWFTVANTFLRVKDPNRATYDYLYAVSADGKNLYHISYQSYELGDFRMFAKIKASEVPQWKEPTSNTTYNQGASTYIPPVAAPSSSSKASSSSSMESASPVLSGVNLRIASGTVVEIYSINGNLMHTHSLANLPKGVYLVKVRFGSDIKILRVPVI
ncbi:MAG: SUMF1/EgtB/PvdO family nonheme iron enzyme [Fibromonadaceae bacterium]|jgi:formylglycine-generating enzyme required for sulfatase activity|nr:SUMF1/EgtB/PvdO family nonheme iron enzyme [Fibromonadaceae bacterium]